MSTSPCDFHATSAMDFTPSLYRGASPPIRKTYSSSKIHSTACAKPTGACAHENTIPKQMAPPALFQAENQGAVGPLVLWTVVGRPVDGRGTASGRSSAVRVSSAAPKNKSFDRGGPVWPPRSNVTNDRLGRGSGGALPPQPKTGGSGGQRPPAKTEKFRKKFKKVFRDKVLVG